MSTIAVANQRNGKPRWPKRTAAILVVAFLVAGTTFEGYQISEASRESHRQQVQRGQEDLARQLTDLRLGKTNFIVLYDTRETDALLQQIEGTAEVETLRIELTDATEVGMASVATLPCLRSLVLYGGRGITNQGLERLAGMPNLEELELTNTLVTNAGLRVLQRLPRLRSLTIDREIGPGVPRDKVLANLKDLSRLEKLALTGGWASPEAVAQLQAQLPNCKIVTDQKRLQE